MQKPQMVRCKKKGGTESKKYRRAAIKARREAKKSGIAPRQPEGIREAGVYWFCFSWHCVVTGRVVSATAPHTHDADEDDDDSGPPSPIPGRIPGDDSLTWSLSRCGSAEAVAVSKRVILCGALQVHSPAARTTARMTPSPPLPLSCRRRGSVLCQRLSWNTPSLRKLRRFRLVSTRGMALGAMVILTWYGEMRRRMLYD